jgi:hypothetical protein
MLERIALRESGIHEPEPWSKARVKEVQWKAKKLPGLPTSSTASSILEAFRQGHEVRNTALSLSPSSYSWVVLPILLRLINIAVC